MLGFQWGRDRMLPAAKQPLRTVAGEWHAPLTERIVLHNAEIGEAAAPGTLSRAVDHDTVRLEAGSK